MFIIIKDLDQEAFLFDCTAGVSCSSVSSVALMTVTLYPQGVVQSQQVDYEVLPDEERQCCKCRTTCYLSAITCVCSRDKMVCLYHTRDICSCPHNKRTLKWVFSNYTNCLNSCFFSLHLLSWHFATNKENLASLFSQIIAQNEVVFLICIK